MASPQPPTVTPGPTARGDIEDELPPAGPPASAEDRKAAAALSSLDAPHDDGAGPEGARNVDAEAVRKAMDRLAGAGAGGGKTGGAGGGQGGGGEVEGKKGAEAAKKVVKVDAADVTLLVSC